MSASTSTEYVLYIDMQFLTILLVDSAVNCNSPSMSMYALSSSVSVSATVNDSMSVEYLYRIYIFTVSIIGLNQEMFPWPQTCEGEQCGENGDGDHSNGQHFAECVYVCKYRHLFIVQICYYIVSITK